MLRDRYDSQLAIPQGEPGAMDERKPIDGPARLALALGFGRPTKKAAGASGTAGAAGTSSTGSAGAGQNAAAGLGVDEFVDPSASTSSATNAGRDGARHVAMKHLPGNALNMVELMQLREHNHLAIREAARRSGDRRSVNLDTVGLELMMKLQGEIERKHFSQAAAGSRHSLQDIDGVRLARGPVDPDGSRKEGDSLQIHRAGRRLPGEAAPIATPGEGQTLSSAAREHAAQQREALLDLSVDAHAQAAADLAALNRAEGLADTLRDLQSERRGSVSAEQETIDELRADHAEGVEAGLRQQLSVSTTHAVRMASAVQGRRMGLNRMLRGRAPR